MIGPLIFTSFYAFLVAWFHWNRVWTDHYFEAGPVYVFYHALRVAFFLYLVLILFVLGRKLLRWVAPKNLRLISFDPLDHFLLASSLGAALMQIVMLILGFLHLYYRSVALVLTVPWVFLSFAILKECLEKTPRVIQGAIPKGPWYEKITHGLLMGATLFLWVDILVRKGLFPDIVGNDSVGHYLPYFNEVISRHHLWPNQYYLHYFYSKGGGLQFLAMLLTDIQGSELTSFYYLTLSALILFSLARKMSFSPTWAWLAVILFLKSFMVPHEAEFAKNHLAMTFWFIALLWLSVRQSISAFLLILVTIALVLNTPASSILTLPYFLSLMAIHGMRRNLELAKTFLSLSILVFSLTGIILSFNYLTSGTMEITPSNIFLPRANLSLMERNWSPFALLTQYEFNVHGGAWLGPSLFRIDKASLWEIFRLHLLHDFFPFLRLKPSYLLAIGIYLVPFILVLVRPRDFKANFKKPLLGMGIMSAACLLILLSTRERHSLINFTQFFSFSTSLVGLTLWTLIFSAFRKPELMQRLSPLVVFLVFLAALFDYGLKGGRLVEERYPFLFGRKSFRQAYGEWVPESCLEVRSLVGDRKVALLNFFPGCYSLPGIQFERPLMNSYVKDYHRVMFEDALTAKETFQRYGIHHFLVDLSHKFHFTAFSPIFRPENMKRVLKVRWQSEGAYLLTWKEAGDEESDGPFLGAYTSKYELEGQSFIAGVHEKVKNLYKTSQDPRKLWG